MSQLAMITTFQKIPNLANFQSTSWRYNSTCDQYSLTSRSLRGRASERERKGNRMNVQANMDASCISRPSGNFRPTMWGDHFQSYTSELTEVTIQEKHELEELKDRIRKLLVETPDDTIQKLVLIDAIQRLGVGYHFANEIETSLQNIFDASQRSDNNIDHDNLYVVALRFRLVRQQGHYISSDVFKQFTYHDAKFKDILTNDVQGLLSLYEAAHLRVHEEGILEEALIFTTAHLESMATNLSNSLKVQVCEALSYPLRKTVPRVGARKYIDIYENIEGRNDLLLKFAKLDFNILQKLHQREISEITSWSNDLDFANKLPYARDILVEGYMWALAVHFEPRYSRARRWVAKVVKLITAYDDTYDAYATFDELVLFNDAIQRWDISSMDLLPPYMRPLYQASLHVCKEMEEVLAKEGKSDRIYYGILEMKKLASSYFKQAEWLNAGYTPTCEEYMKIATVSAGIMVLGTNALVGMEEVITKDIFEWASNEPSIFRASSAITRLVDDVTDHTELQQRGDAPSIIECFVKEYGASREEAIVKYREEINNCWKDINKELLRPTEAPMFVMERVQNLARAMDTYFQGEDGFTDSFKLKDIITLLLVEPIII